MSLHATLSPTLTRLPLPLLPPLLPEPPSSPPAWPRSSSTRFSCGSCSAQLLPHPLAPLCASSPSSSACALPQPPVAYSLVHPPPLSCAACGPPRSPVAHPLCASAPFSCSPVQPVHPTASCPRTSRDYSPPFLTSSWRGRQALLPWTSLKRVLLNPPPMPCKNPLGPSRTPYNPLDPPWNPIQAFAIPWNTLVIPWNPVDPLSPGCSSETRALAELEVHSRVAQSCTPLQLPKCSCCTASMPHCHRQ